ncbi:MAG: hypothetical protein IJ733_01405, partial [Lachnospiraceae bacterium]|nr:hypothetical protein [Lachnospiraceae bacterium]
RQSMWTSVSRSRQSAGKRSMMTLAGQILAAKELPVSALLSNISEWRQQNMRKEGEPKKTITYTVAECSEFHELGEYHENVKTISEAKRLFDRINPERMHGIPAIGINIHTEGTPDYEDTQWDFYVGNRIELDLLEYLPQIAECPEAMEAIKELMAAYPTAEVFGSLPEGVKQGQEGQENGKNFQYGADAFEEHLRTKEQMGQSAALVAEKSISQEKTGR